MTTSRLLAVVVALQGMILLGQLGGGSVVSPAIAQVPDAGAQRLEMIEELRALNAKLEKIEAILTDGELQVRVVSSDEDKQDNRAK
jgi:hypothetical protein